MNKQELQNKIENLEKQLAELKEQVNSSESEGIEKGVRQRPKIGEIYYFLGDNGYIYNTEWEDFKEDLFRFNTDNCFKTEQEAKDYKENLLTKQQLKDLALELNNGVEIDWVNETQKKYCFVYSHNKNKLDYTPNEAWQELGHIYSLDYKFLEIAKDRIGEEKLIKLIKSGVQNMNNETKDMFYYILEKQDSFWKQTISYVIDWLVNQGFEITYKGK